MRPLLEELVSPALVRGVGYALLHSLWQGGVLALLLAGVLPLLRRQRAEVRYAASAAALGTLVLAAGLTLGYYYQTAPVASIVETQAAVALKTTAGLSVKTSQAAPAPAAAAGALPATLATAAAPAHIAAPLVWLRVTSRLIEAYLPLVVVAWLLGLLLMSGRLAGGLLYAGRLRRAGTQALGAEWQQRLAALAARAGLRRPVALLESARVAGPLVLGHLRPVILLPLGAVAGLSPSLLEALLAHELAHIVRRDYLLNLGLAVAEVLFFYHPAVWFMAHCLRAERENCCDDQAAALCGGDRLRVARALAALAELEATYAPTPRLALAAAGPGGRGSLLARVRRLALGRPEAPTMSERLLAGSLTLLGLLGLSTGVVLAASPAPAAAPQQGTRPATPTDTARRPVVAMPPLPPAPPAPPMAEAPRQLDKVVRVDVLNGEQLRLARPPRRGPASTVVIEKDKKGRVVNLTVNGERVETNTGKKAKRAKPVRTVEVVRVPDPALRFERPETPERPGNSSFSFGFSTTTVGEDALRTARRGLAEALRNPDLTTEQRQEMEKELRKLEKESASTRTFGNGSAFREFHFNVKGSATAHRPNDPRFYIKNNRLKIYKSGPGKADRAAAQADRDAAQADRAAEEADRDAAQADRDAAQADHETSRAELAGRRAELRARMAADAAELRALEQETGRSRMPAPPRAPRTPLGPLGPVPPQTLPAPPPPPAPKTAELRAALRQDGLISKDERSFSFQLNDKGGRVNGKALTPAQVARYRQVLGQPVSGKGNSSSFTINISEN
ncbi:M56 family metallopeptidase [Hymenobacter sp. H14-R3]|uniref:M56 family metallopeptidase n=1 Tax=Hymenobacter sp. H14-R3 TaxID=3046308 RepID=UPI0024BBE5A4|nr:M56 family metallopeptidase [Hymenobacter sp. H14-R3]MDJ0367840.1 M56 family metallopeptidase [Hymenobacter sp. H14-R3]